MVLLKAKSMWQCYLVAFFGVERLKKVIEMSFEECDADGERERKGWENFVTLVTDRRFMTKPPSLSTFRQLFEPGLNTAIGATVAQYFPRNREY